MSLHLIVRRFTNCLYFAVSLCRGGRRRKTIKLSRDLSDLVVFTNSVASQECLDEGEKCSYSIWLSIPAVKALQYRCLKNSFHYKNMSWMMSTHQFPLSSKGCLKIMRLTQAFLHLHSQDRPIMFYHLVRHELSTWCTIGLSASWISTNDSSLGSIPLPTGSTPVTLTHRRTGMWDAN